MTLTSKPFSIFIFFFFLFFSTLADDDYSPEEAVKLFPFSRDMHRLQTKLPLSTKAPRHTLATLKLDPDRVYSIMNLDHEKLAHYVEDNASFSSREFNPMHIFQMSSNSTESLVSRCLNLFGVGLQRGVVPVLVFSIEFVGVIANLLPLISFITSKKMRNGHNLLLLNVVVADLVYICSLAPLTTLHFSHPQPSHITSCRIGHYMIFVSVYVSMYSLVVTCLFALMNGLCYNKPSDLITSHGFKPQATKYLSIFSSGILCLVVWLSFLLSHAHILLPSSSHLISSPIYQPIVCNLPSNHHNLHHHDDKHPYLSLSDDEDESDNRVEDVEKVKTLWMTFLTCACIIPFLVVLLISAFVFVRTKSSCRSYRNNYHSNKNYSNNHYSNNYSHNYDENHYKSGSYYESVQNKENHFKNKRDLATVVLIAATVRVLSWLPTIILVFVAASLRGEGAVDTSACGGSHVLKRLELVALCLTLVCSCCTPVIYFSLVEDFKTWLMTCCKKEKKKALVVGGMALNPAVTNRSSLLRQMNEGTKMNETIMSIISDSSNHINYLG